MLNTALDRERLKRLNVLEGAFAKRGDSIQQLERTLASAESVSRALAHENQQLEAVVRGLKDSQQLEAEGRRQEQALSRAQQKLAKASKRS